MLGFWRWAGPTVLLAGALAVFMALDKTTLHWYVPESARSTVSTGDVTPAGTAADALDSTATPAGSAGALVTPTAIPRFAAAEVRALALQFVAQTYQTPTGYDCAAPELNESRSRWTSICTARDRDAPEPVIAIAVDAVTGFAADLRSYAQYADNTATAVARNATATAIAAATSTAIANATATAAAAQTAAAAAQTAAAGRTPQR